MQNSDLCGDVGLYFFKQKEFNTTIKMCGLQILSHFIRYSYEWWKVYNISNLIRLDKLQEKDTLSPSAQHLFHSIKGESRRLKTSMINDLDSIKMLKCVYFPILHLFLTVLSLKKNKTCQYFATAFLRKILFNLLDLSIHTQKCWNYFD